MVEAGLGVAAVPQLAMPAGNSHLIAVALTSPAVRRELGLITQRGLSLSPAAKELYGFITDLKKLPTA